MNILRTLLVDCNFKSEKDDFCKFRSESTFLDYDLVIWEPSKLFREYNVDRISPSYAGYPHIESIESRNLLSDYHRRREEIKNLMDIGRYLVVFVPQSDTVVIHVSGQRDPKKYNIVNLIPLENLGYEKASGSNFEFKGATHLRNFWTPISHLFQYENYFSNSVEGDFVFIKGTTKAVGRILQIGEGYIIGLPALRSNSSKDEQMLVIEAIKNLVADLRGNESDFVLPTWGKALSVAKRENARASGAGVFLQFELFSS